MHTDIGCSGYKIDIGIVDPQNPSSYRLGIICDGKNYKRTKTARDREIVQKQCTESAWMGHLPYMDDGLVGKTG